MNKFKSLIEPEKTDLDKIFSNKLKKFNSERNLFFANIYGSDCVNNEKLSKFEKTTSFLKNEFLKKCKSLKDIYNNQSYYENEIKLSSTATRFDDFEQNYLFRGAKKNLVRELRKNFENDLHRSNSVTGNGNGVIQKSPLNQCEFSATDIQKRMSLREKSNSELPPRKPIGRNSFYTHRRCFDYETNINNTINVIHINQTSEYNAVSTDNLPINANGTCFEPANNNNNSNQKRATLNGKHTMGKRMNSFATIANNVEKTATLIRDNRWHQVDRENNTANIKIRKCNSVYQIDLDLLRKELDDFSYYKWKTINRNYGLLSVRGQLHKELDLEQKIDLEIKMREGSAKLLAACNNPKNGSKTIGYNSGSSLSPHNTQMLEAAKNLLTSNERMTAYMAELQRRKKDREMNTKSHRPTARVSVNEIRMPLMWRDSDHFKNKGDHRRFAVFCLLKIGTEIYDTSLLFPVDRNLTDISFSDAILFSNVTPDFELKLEVYAVMLESDLSIASTPRKIKNTIHSSISRTVGKRLAANLKDELNNTKIGPKFDLIASAQLTLAEASDLPHTHDLTLMPNNTSPNANVNNKLPLFGHFCCRLAVQPDCIENIAHSGELHLISKGPARKLEGYGKLQAFQIEFWDDSQKCQNNFPARYTVEISRDTKIKHKSDTELQLNIMEEGTIQEYILRCVSASETTKWYSALRKLIKEHLQWDHVSLRKPMQLASPGNCKQYFLRSPRQGSLYDQVPIIGTEKSESTARPTVHEIFAIPNSINTSPTLSDFRNRCDSVGRRSSQSSSTMSASSFGSINSKKSNWPFSNGK